MSILSDNPFQPEPVYSDSEISTMFGKRSQKIHSILTLQSSMYTKFSILSLEWKNNVVQLDEEITGCLIV